MTQTTYYRVQTSTTTACGASLCEEPSNCLIVEVLELPDVTVSATDTTCGEDNGTITFTYPDNPARTQIEFSLDGGSTNLPSVRDHSRSTTYTDLASGTYDLYVRWGNTECPVDLPDVMIGASTAAPCFGIGVTRN